MGTERVGAFDPRCRDKLALPFMLGPDACQTWGYTDSKGHYMGYPFTEALARPRYGTLSHGVQFCDAPLRTPDYVFTARIGDVTPYSTVPPVLRVLVNQGAVSAVWRFPQNEERGVVWGCELWVGPDGDVVRQGDSSWERTAHKWKMRGTGDAEAMCLIHSKRLGLDPCGWDVMFDRDVPKVIEANSTPYLILHEPWA